VGKLVTPADLFINNDIAIPEAELDFTAIRSQGPGGQNVNKVSSAIQLRFDINASMALTEEIKARLRGFSDRRIAAGGVITIKAQRSRSQEKNRSDALKRFRELVLRATVVPKKRVATRPSKKSKLRRLEDKAHRARLKQARSKNIE
jgi:ribosome-associated protein